MKYIMKWNAGHKDMFNAILIYKILQMAGKDKTCEVLQRQFDNAFSRFALFLLLYVMILQFWKLTCFCT